jgi:hypothetical protein
MTASLKGSAVPVGDGACSKYFRPASFAIALDAQMTPNKDATAILVHMAGFPSVLQTYNLHPRRPKLKREDAPDRVIRRGRN